SSSACAHDAHAAWGDPDAIQQSSRRTADPGAIVETAAACPDRLRTRLPSAACACLVTRIAPATCPGALTTAADRAHRQRRQGRGRRPLDLACLTRQTGNASGGAAGAAPPIRHRRASLLVADPDWGCRARYERRRAPATGQSPADAFPTRWSRPAATTLPALAPQIAHATCPGAISAGVGAATA